MTPKILCSDGGIIVAVKPRLVISEDAGEGSMPRLLETAVGSLPLTVHRLDREVGGVMVYAKDRKTAAELTAQISEGGVYKGYLAVVCGCPEEVRGRLCDLLYHDRAKNKTYVVSRERRGVKSALLEYRTVATKQTENGTRSLVVIHLLTGRTHQIRAQFASRRMPLAGDVRYGGPKGCGISLYSAYLSFSDPQSGRTLEFSSFPGEDDGEFNLFTDEINCMKEERFYI